MEHNSQTQITQVTPGQGLSIGRYFTRPGEDPFEQVEWERRDARIGHGERVSFEQRDVEFPKSWSQNATNIPARPSASGRCAR
jgi:ribonucleoside-diphosphate reductase alpha chain